MSFKSASEIKSPKFIRALAYEFLGTFMLILSAVGSGSHSPDDDSPINSLKTPFAVGFSVATAVWCGLHTGGSQVNPAVSFAFFITRRIGLFSFFLHAAFQVFGATTAVCVLKFVSPPGFNDDVGAQTLGRGVTWSQGLIIEAIATFLLILVVLATFDSARPHHGGSGPLHIGLCFTLCQLWARPLTGCSMNPARAIASHIVSGIVHHYPYVWIYWAGPFLGSLVASLLYHLVFAGDFSVDKFKNYFKDISFELL